MAIFDTVVITLHLVVAGVWTGSVIFATVAVLPTVRDGSATIESLERITTSLKRITRGSSLLLLGTGGHLAGTFYPVATLTGSTRGHLVLAMVVLWLVLTALVEVGGTKLADNVEPAAARAARPYLVAASVTAVVLLVNGGLLASGVG